MDSYWTRNISHLTVVLVHSLSIAQRPAVRRCCTSIFRTMWRNHASSECRPAKAHWCLAFPLSNAQSHAVLGAFICNIAPWISWIISFGWLVENEISLAKPAFFFSPMTTLECSRKLKEARYLLRMNMKCIPAPPYFINMGKSSSA